jgi:3-oxoadipate enol-lactonase
MGAARFLRLDLPRRQRAAAQRLTIDMPTARVNGIDIWYEFAGDADRPTFVLTHGFAGPTGGWPPVLDEVRPHVRLLLYDVRAHGRTTVPDSATVTMPQFAADLVGLMDHLGIERPHLGGVSMGGMVSAQFACDYPDRLRSLLLCDTTAGNQGDPLTAQIERDLARIFERTARIVEKHGLSGLAERENLYRREQDPYAAKSSFSIDEQDERNWQRIARMTDEGFLAANRALRERPDLTARTPKIAVPTLVSCGEWDMFYPCAQRDHRLIPNSRFATVRGAAHDTTNYTPQLWKRAVLDFIADVEAGRDVRGETEYA